MDGIDISMATHCSISDINLQVIYYWSRIFLEDWENLPCLQNVQATAEQQNADKKTEALE